MLKTAVLIDGGFFLRRYRTLCDKYKNPECDPKMIANHVLELALRHTERNNSIHPTYLYRIFFYDCPPHMKRQHNPISKKSIDYSKSEQAKFTIQLHKELKKTRKVALRLGELIDEGWVFKEEIAKQLMSKEISLEDITEQDVYLRLRQKQVDMKIGIDIASLAYKKQVDQIVLVSGDRDFVPAAKLARREGIDFILDSMGRSVNDALFDNIDGLQTNPKNNTHKYKSPVLTKKAAND